MKKFHQCPRCDTKYFFKRWYCKKCKFENYLTTDELYQFKTDKYEITCSYINDMIMISNINPKKSPYNYHIYCTTPIFNYIIHKKLLPKATDDDIEKLLTLL